MNGSSMWEAPFVNTFQNKDNILTYTKKICKSPYKMQKMLFLFVLSFFLSNSQKFTYNAAFFFIYPFIYLCCSYSRIKLYIVRAEKVQYLPYSILSRDLNLEDYWQAIYKNKYDFV